MIDGKQRLNAIWAFIDGDYALSSDFEYVRDGKVGLRDLKYSEMAIKYPDVKQDFDSWKLDIVSIETDDLELIEDLFSRLNEAMPLNAAEKRNAYKGPLPAVVRRVSKHEFFATRLPFGNRRYRHFDIVAKMLYSAHRGGVPDTKKAYIDEFFRNSVKFDTKDVKKMESRVSSVLDYMSLIFVKADPLLRQVGMNMIYYHLFSKMLGDGSKGAIDRKSLLEFDEKRAENRKLAADDIAAADYDLLEFNRYTQWPNDGIAMKFRLGVLDQHLFDGKLGFQQ